MYLLYCRCVYVEKEIATDAKWSTIFELSDYSMLHGRITWIFPEAVQRNISCTMIKLSINDPCSKLLHYHFYRNLSWFVGVFQWGKRVVHSGKRNHYFLLFLSGTPVRRIVCWRAINNMQLFKTLLAPFADRPSASLSWFKVSVKVCARRKIDSLLALVSVVESELLVNESLIHQSEPVKHDVAFPRYIEGIKDVMS